MISKEEILREFKLFSGNTEEIENKIKIIIESFFRCPKVYWMIFIIIYYGTKSTNIISKH